MGFRRMINILAVAITLLILVSLETTAKGEVSPQIRTDTKDLCPNGWKFFDYIETDLDDGWRGSVPRCVTGIGPNRLNAYEAQSSCESQIKTCGPDLAGEKCCDVYECGLFGYGMTGADWTNDV